MGINITAVPTTCRRTDTPAPDFKEKMFLFWDVKYGLTITIIVMVKPYLNIKIQKITSVNRE